MLSIILLWTADRIPHFLSSVKNRLPFDEQVAYQDKYTTDINFNPSLWVLVISSEFDDPWNPPSRITWSQSDVSEEAIKENKVKTEVIDKVNGEDFFGIEQQTEHHWILKQVRIKR